MRPTLQEIAADLTMAGALSAASGVRPSDITEDSREVGPGTLFVARGGRTVDGRDFIADALERGACAVLCEAPSPIDDPRVAPVERLGERVSLIAERFFGYPSRSLVCVGVTGSNGKTTVAGLVRSTLESLGVPCGGLGTVANSAAGKTSAATHTTPPPIELSRLLATMRDGGARACAMEVSSHALDQGRAAAIDFDVAVFTNLSGDHLDYHGTMEAYGEAKARLFSTLRSGALAVVSDEDGASDRMLRRCRARVSRCGFGASADCGVRVERSDAEGATLALRGPWGEIEARVGLIGRHNAMNVLQAAVAAWEAARAMGVETDVEALRRAVESVRAPEGRFEPVRVDGQTFTVLVDYAHTDDALRRALEALQEITPADASLRVVFGCGGDRDATKRPRMGRVAADLADEIIITSDNPRREDPVTIIEQVLRGVPKRARERVTEEPDRARAIRLAIKRAKSDDVVLIAGKGHETYQVLPDGSGGTVTRDFDDREVARAALLDRFGGERGEAAA